MPENPTDGKTRQAEFTQGFSTYSTRTKSKGSLGAGGQGMLDRDQDQWITEREARPGPRPMDHGETDGRQAVNPDQDQWITGRTNSAGASSTRTKSNGSTGSIQAEKEKSGARGRMVGIQNCYAPPVSKDAADGVLAVD